MTHPKLLQVHRQTIVRKTGGEPAEGDRQLLMTGGREEVVTGRQVSRETAGHLNCVQVLNTPCCFCCVVVVAVVCKGPQV